MIEMLAWTHFVHSKTIHHTWKSNKILNVVNVDAIQSVIVATLPLVSLSYPCFSLVTGWLTGDVPSVLWPYRELAQAPRGFDTSGCGILTLRTNASRLWQWGVWLWWKVDNIPFSEGCDSCTGWRYTSPRQHRTAWPGTESILQPVFLFLGPLRSLVPFLRTKNSDTDLEIIILKKKNIMNKYCKHKWKCQTIAIKNATKESTKIKRGPNVPSISNKTKHTQYTACNQTL